MPSAVAGVPRVKIPYSVLYCIAWAPLLAPPGTFPYALMPYSNEKITQILNDDGVKKDLPRIPLQLWGERQNCAGGEADQVYAAIVAASKDPKINLNLSAEEARAFLAYATTASGTWLQGGMFRIKEAMGLYLRSDLLRFHKKADNNSYTHTITRANEKQLIISFDMKDEDLVNTDDCNETFSKEPNHPYIEMKAVYNLTQHDGIFSLSVNTENDSTSIRADFWRDKVLPNAYQKLNTAILEPVNIFSLTLMLVDATFTKAYIKHLATQSPEMIQLALHSIREWAYKDSPRDLARIEKEIEEVGLDKKIGKIALGFSTAALLISLQAPVINVPILSVSNPKPINKAQPAKPVSSNWKWYLGAAIFATVAVIASVYSGGLAGILGSSLFGLSSSSFATTAGAAGGSNVLIFLLDEPDLGASVSIAGKRFRLLALA